MNNVLDEIVSATRAALRERNPDEASVREAARAIVSRKQPHRFASALASGVRAAAGEPPALHSLPKIIAEIKAASPSAGSIVEHPDVERIATEYAHGGASAISVVTEPRFFHGSTEWVGRAASASNLPVLMKDFIVESVQIYEAAAAGADAILLISAILDSAELRRLCSIVDELGLDTLVEVHDERELAAALAAGAKMIGVNNRNLRDFSVDLGTAERLAPWIPPDVFPVAESGIRSRADIDRLRSAGFPAFLVGESLLRQENLANAVRSLIGPQVKICGITRLEDAQAAVEAGASFLGFVFAGESPRRIDSRRAHEIAQQLRDSASIVGVFRDQPVEEVRRIAEEVSLDYIQLHGRETASEIAQMPRPVIKAVPVNRTLPDCSGYAGADWLLFDAVMPGSGQRFDWDLLGSYGREKRFFLAGGLGPESIAEAVRRVCPDAVDVSSGVEISPGIKSAERIRQLFSALR